MILKNSYSSTWYNWNILHAGLCSMSHRRSDERQAVDESESDKDELNPARKCINVTLG